MSHVLQALQPQDLPPLRDFIVSPGFGGAAALLAAIIALCAVLYASRRAAKRLNKQLEQREHHHQEALEDQEHDAAVNRCWRRLVWVVETAALEPAASENATVSFGPELALAILRGLLRDAEQLGDDTLAGAVTVYLNQFGLVLAQQGGPLSSLAAAPSPSADGKPHRQPTSPTDEKPDDAAASATDAAPTTTEDVTRGERRRRR